MKSLIEKAAKADLEGAAAHYEQERPGLSQDFLAEFEAVLERIEELPRAAYSDSLGNRHVPFPRFPFKVVYFIDGDLIRVMSVAHKRREPGFWRNRR